MNTVLQEVQPRAAVRHFPLGPILVVQNDRENLSVIRAAVEQGDFTNPIRECRNSLEAVSYLNGFGVYGNRNQYPLPGLLILDLQMPCSTAQTLLEWIRSNPQLNDLAVIGTGPWANHPILQRAFDLGLSAYVRVPHDVGAIPELIQKMEFFPVLCGSNVVNA